MTTTEVALPDLGTGVSSGELVAWLVEPGDHVTADQTIAEVETDKSLVEIPTPASGVITELRADPGAQVAADDVVAVVEIDESAEAEADGEAESSAAPEFEERTATSQGDESEASGRVFAPPRVRRLARDLSVDVTTIEGTGDGGAITESDVRAAAEKTSSNETSEQSTSETSERVGPRTLKGGTAVTASRETSSDAAEKPGAIGSDASPRQLSAAKPALRRREGDTEPLAERVESDLESAGSASAEAVEQTDERVAESSSAVPAGSSATGTRTTHHDEVDVTALRAARERLAAAGVAGGEISDLAFVIRAVAAALESVPALNGPIEGGEIDRRQAVNVAISIPTDDGLVDPVVVDANDVGLPALAREVSELVDRAKNGSLSPPETADGTFTVTDFGALGGTYATPSVAAAGTAVLALGEIRERPRIRDGEVTARAILPLSIAVDARAVDGAAAAQFLTEVRRYLNTPELLLLE